LTCGFAFRGAVMVLPGRPGPCRAVAACTTAFCARNRAQIVPGRRADPRDSVGRPPRRTAESCLGCSLDLWFGRRVGGRDRRVACDGNAGSLTDPS
jgi:hypothetical protein